MTDIDRWEQLAARYLRELARADMKAWRQHLAFGEQAAAEEHLDDEQRSTHRLLRRVHHQRRQEA